MARESRIDCLLHKFVEKFSNSKRERFITNKIKCAIKCTHFYSRTMSYSQLLWQTMWSELTGSPPKRCDWLGLTPALPRCRKLRSLLRYLRCLRLNSLLLRCIGVSKKFSRKPTGVNEYSCTPGSKVGRGDVRWHSEGISDIIKVWDFACVQCDDSWVTVTKCFAINLSRSVWQSLKGTATDSPFWAGAGWRRLQGRPISQRPVRPLDLEFSSALCPGVGIQWAAYLTCK